MKRKPKKKSPTWYRKKCVAIAKEEAKKRDKYACQHCPRTKAQGYQMHGNHIKPEGVYPGLSADEDNIITLCARCHVGGAWKNDSEPSWHEDPLYFADWFEKKYPGKKQMLNELAQSVLHQVINWEKLYKEIKSL